jgi:hypothetical protein
LVYLTRALSSNNLAAALAAEANRFTEFYHCLPPIAKPAKDNAHYFDLMLSQNALGLIISQIVFSSAHRPSPRFPHTYIFSVSFRL